jgi:hypothetical protein
MKRTVELKTTTHNKLYTLLRDPENKDRYYDEGPAYRSGFKCPNKCISAYRVRMYSTWKYNRSNQFKEEKREASNRLSPL